MDFLKNKKDNKILTPEEEIEWTDLEADLIWFDRQTDFLNEIQNIKLQYMQS